MDANNDNAESIALKWILHNACTSNVELATISNVCQQWRDVCIEAIATEAVSASAAMTTHQETPSGVKDDDDAMEESSLSEQNNNISMTEQLLISDMARELIVRQQQQQRQLQHTKQENKVDTTAHDDDQSPSNNATDHQNNFCLAWFAPSGIQTTSVSLEEDDDDDSEDEDDLQFNFGANNNTAGGPTMQQYQNNKMRGIKKIVTTPGRSVACCTEWRGYRHATEVLFPFGYCASFVRRVLNTSAELALGGSRECETDSSISTESISPDSTAEKKSKPPSRLYTPTFAVRGATLARPEGYCLCIDNDYIDHVNNPNSNFTKPHHTTLHRVPSCIDAWMNDYDTNNHWPLQKNVGLSPFQRKRKQTNLAKALLPRMVLSTRRKYPLLHRFAETDDANENDTKGGTTQCNLPWEKRQRAIQFLNSDRSQAIKLITPQFDCGPTCGPVTMFIIAITTEDGCFVSGRSNRFEVGHLYPLGQRDMAHDTAPIAIATGKRSECKANDGITDSGMANYHRSSTAGTNTTMPDADDDDDDDDDSSDEDSEDSLHCLCPLDSGDPFNPKDVSIEDPSENCIHRGSTGPGLWHCYTAIFDGKKSILRVDGHEEPKRTREDYDLVDSDEDEDDSDHPTNASKFVGSGALDGLSIGSDHQFDMSLCYGEIEGEAGQGSISELAVFKGRMDDVDIVQIESYLMKKHGLLSVDEKRAFVAKGNSTRMKPLNIECHLQEDEWKKEAHAFIEQRRPWKMEGRVPLRVAANHPSVAWHRTNDITGGPVRITRIGAKNSNGSSDW